MAKAGYFKVSMDAARAIVEATEGPELLAGYITVCCFAYGAGRTTTRAGAKAIRIRAGYTDHRSKKIMGDLRSLRFGECGERGLLKPTGNKVGNAAVNEIEPWDGTYAYLPSILLDQHPEHGGPLTRLLTNESLSRATTRDALLMLLHVYSCTDYAEWFGCPPDQMAYQTFNLEGFAGEDFELGYQGEVASLSLWLAALPEDGSWNAPVSVINGLFGPGGGERFWAALWGLVESYNVIRVVSVQTGGRAYPLWVYSAGYRDSLREFGVVPDLAAEAQLAACDSGLDPDNNVIRYAVDEMGRAGTGMFYCVGSNPMVRTVLVPRLHAPTPINLDGLKEAAVVTRDLWREIRSARRLERSA